jgi:hypothetical protein
MSLTDRVRIAARFHRAVRVDTDLANPAALEGFLCTSTFARTLTTLAQQWARSMQAAFTWTGPYGGGKSSLAIALAALLGPRGRARDQAQKAAGPQASTVVLEAFKPGPRGWKVIPIIAGRAPPATLVWESLVNAGLVRPRGRHKKVPPDADVLAALERCAKRSSYAGLFLLFDELGKVLEYLAATNGDLHFFQELAERAARSHGRLLVLGVLHQAFDEYAGRLGRDARTEWAKVQGRYLDIPLTVSGPEQLEILSRAIVSNCTSPSQLGLADVVAGLLKHYRPDTPASVASDLRRCWPLHPVTACLLGPISRRRFGQNQRSLFAFLNSHEAAGFQDFLAGSSSEIYGPDRLFDYLRLNLEPAILASPDGHRWSLALEALSRSEMHQPRELHVRMLKAIALLDLFRERSGLYASTDVLRAVAGDVSARDFRETLKDLKDWSVVTYREHLSAYAIYAGSDFDLQGALDEAEAHVGQPDLSRLKVLANLRPIVAKRHYHETGALRWFETDVVPLSQVENSIRNFSPNGAIGQFLLVVATEGESTKQVTNRIKEASAKALVPMTFGHCRSGGQLLEFCGELIALEYVRKHRGELASDAVARREVDARIATVSASLEAELRDAFSLASWFYTGGEVTVDGPASLARLASDIADATYARSPRLRNELLNRSAPSSNAVAAQKSLLRAMVASAANDRLAIEGYPAEGGLYDSLLRSTGLHTQSGSLARFIEPSGDDPANLRPLWRATDQFLDRASNAPVSAADVYKMWQAPPYGVREGLQPVLFVAYLQSRANRYTTYLDSQLEVALTDLTVDRLVQDPASLSLRRFDAGDRERRLLQGLRETVVELGAMDDSAASRDAVALARAIVGIVKLQPPFVLRTQSLSSSAARVRAAVRAAEDPHTLLYETLPAVAAEISGVGPAAPIDISIGTIRAGLQEIAGAYARMLLDIAKLVQSELNFDVNDAGIEELHGRAAHLKGLTGELRLEAFVGRLTSYQATPEEVEGLAGLAANKPARDFTDHDVDRAKIELADLAQRFNRAEAFARVKGRPDGRHAIAFVVGLDRAPSIASQEFEISESDRRQVLEIARDIQDLVDRRSNRKEIALAALAQVGSGLLTAASKRRLRAVNE